MPVDNVDKFSAEKVMPVPQWHLSITVFPSFHSNYWTVDRWTENSKVIVRNSFQQVDSYFFSTFLHLSAGRAAQQVFKTFSWFFRSFVHTVFCAILQLFDPLFYYELLRDCTQLLNRFSPCFQQLFRRSNDRGIRRPDRFPRPDAPLPIRP